jgi:hypothetical protein
MDPVSLVMGLACVVPSVLQWLGHGNAAASAGKIIDITRQVSGETQGEAAVAAVRQNPALALQLQQEINRYQEVLLQLKNEENINSLEAETETTTAVNRTMEAESQSERWPAYSWRPFIGFCFGITALFSAATVAVCYLGVMFFQADGKVLGALPGLIGAEAGIMATMSPVLGIASWFRGKMQVSPDMNSDSRG